jgi:septal ring factor EnvC (AmiA/AmiB activator)
MTNNTRTAGEGQQQTIWHYARHIGLWLLLLLAGLALERLGITSTSLTSLIPSDVEQLRATTVEQADKQQRVMDENQRLKGLIGREQACQDALNICQGEKKKLEEQTKAGNN